MLAEALARIARVPRLLVALDYDGVLAPIVAVPSDARPLPASRDVVEALAAVPDTTVVLVSGRGSDDLAAVSGFGPPVRMVGSHGAEFDDGPAPLSDDQLALLEKVSAELQALVEPGVTLEPKPAGMAVHVRNAPDDVGERVLDAVLAGPAAHPGVFVTPGKKVLDLAVLEVSKGTAIETLRERADAVFFAGDDVTDESAFERLRAGDVGVKVGEGETAAEFRVADPEALAAVLATLHAARTRDRTGSPPDPA